MFKTDEELVSAVDNILLSLDLNSDGYIDWPEFLKNKENKL